MRLVIESVGMQGFNFSRGVRVMVSENFEPCDIKPHIDQALAEFFAR